MTPKQIAVAIVVLGPAVAAAVQDLETFTKARKEDPTAKFDAALFAARFAKGLLVGLGAVMGVSTTGVL